MKRVLICTLFVSCVFAQEWQIQRNPFVVSKNYMDKTGKHYLVPKDTYSFLNIEVKGILYKDGIKTALLDLDDKGFIHLKEGEVANVDTADISSKVKIVKIEQSFVMISTNGGEAIRYDIK